jgi:chromosomal replication initiator protein
MSRPAGDFHDHSLLRRRAAFCVRQRGDGQNWGYTMTPKSRPPQTPATSNDTPNDQWRRVQARLKAEYGDAVFNSWLAPLMLADLHDGQVTLTVPTRFMRDWVVGNYGDRIREFWRLERPTMRVVSVQVRQRPAAKSAEALANVPAADPEPLAEGDDVSAPLDARLTFDTFVVGKSNELAYAAARRVAEAAAVPFNPLFLCGGVGLGKTHLMHAIAWHFRKSRPKSKVIYLSAEKFMYQFVKALRFKDTLAFKQQFRGVDLLLIDDVQFIAGKDSTQEEFFHTFNALCDQNRQIVISGDRSPSDLDGIEERMRSRLGYGLVAEIHQTDYELRLSILQAKAERSGLKDAPAKVLEFLAHRITSNVRELEGALNRLLAYSSLIGRAITLESAQEVLQDLLRANDRRVTIDEIQKRVAEHFNLRLSDMHSARRARAVARPRQIAMYLSKQLTARSLPEIGRKFGGRDHTTVMHAVKKVEELREVDAIFADDVDLLRRMLEG